MNDYPLLVQSIQSMINRKGTTCSDTQYVFMAKMLGNDTFVINDSTGKLSVADRKGILAFLKDVMK